MTLSVRPVDTYPVGMNITLSVPDDVVERVREVARSRGTSLNALVRDYLAALAAGDRGDDVAETFRSVWAMRTGHSAGRTVTRGDVYAERTDRWVGA